MEEDLKKKCKPMGCLGVITSLLKATFLFSVIGFIFLSLAAYCDGNFWSWVWGFLAFSSVFGWFGECRAILRRYKWYHAGRNVSDAEIERVVGEVVEEVAAEMPNECKTAIPLGRAHAYLTNFMGRSIYSERVHCFKPERSATQEELREYGYMLTDSGLCLAKQYDTAKSDEENRKEKVLMLSFQGVYDVQRDGEKLELYFSDSTSPRKVNKGEVPVSLETLENVYRKLLSTGVSAALFRKQFRKGQIGDAVGDYSEENEWQAALNSGRQAVAAAAAMGGIAESQVHKYHARGRGGIGHGWAAEDANTLADKLSGQEACVVGGNNLKSGPDRLVNGVEIQTKYCGSAQESVAAAFDKITGEYKYRGQNGSSVQQLEVPCDQYDDAVRLMRKKIADGKVPGETDPDCASKIVRKGAFTLGTVKAITKAGTLQSVSFDLATGAYVCVAPGGMTAALSFALAMWNGADKKEAAKIGLYNGAKVIGVGALMYTVTAQLSRETTIIGTNLIASSAKNVARSIRRSAIAKTSLGKSAGFNKVSGKALVGTGVVAAVTFGPDIARALIGRISVRQLLKNSAVGASGLGGAAIGQALIPIPLVGAAVGAMASALLAKAVLDEFVEDDAVAMFFTLKEEFIDQVMLISFCQDEFNNLVATVFQQPNMARFFRDMYEKKGDAREYAREFVNDAIAAVLKERRIVTDADFATGIKEIAADSAA